MADNQGYKIVKGFNTNAGLSIYDYDSLANKPDIEGMIQDALEEFVPPVDNTLSNEGSAADAKATGDALSALNEKIGSNSVEEQINQSEQKVVKQFNQSIEDAISAIPPNQTLTFEGAVEATYDGSEPIKVAIPVIDNSLEVEGKAADAKATGDAIGAALKKMDEEVGQATKTYVDDILGDIEGFVAQSEPPEQHNVLWIDTDDDSINDIENVEQIHKLAADAYGLANQADKKVDTLREVVSKFHSNIVEEVKGDIISLNDSSGMELAGLRIFGKTFQNGIPSPDAPAALESVGKDGSVGVTVCGKNLAPNFKNNTVNGAVFTANDDGSVTVSGTATNQSIFSRSVYLPKGTYCVSGAPSGSAIGSWDMYVTYDSVVRARSYDGSTQTVFSLEKGTTLYLVLRVPSGTLKSKTFYPQLEVGTVATKYEPSEKKNLSVPTPNGLPGIPVTSDGNYTDETGQQWICDEIDFANGKYIQRVYRYTFTGQEKFSSLDSGKTLGSQLKELGLPVCVVPQNSSGSNISPMLCSHEKVTSQNELKNGTDAGIAVATWGGTHYVYFSGAYYGNVDGLKTALANAYASGNPYVWLYALATHDIRELTEAEKADYTALRTNYPNTTVFNDENAGMGIRYIADTKLYIDNKFQALEAAIAKLI